MGIGSSGVVSTSDDFVRVNGTEPTAAVTHKLGLPDRARSDSSEISDNDEDDEVINIYSSLQQVIISL